jgi:asparagine synthase (glutamine-hydrolysing)
LDFQSFLPDDILVKVDRASMAVSLEVRAPWLDQHIIEFAYKSVPGHLKKDVKILKILPRMVAEKLLPPDLDINRKQGFGIPLRQWLRHDWRAFSHDALHNLDTKLFNKAYVDSLLNDLDKGIDNSPQIFLLLSFAVWQDCYGVTLAE